MTVCKHCNTDSATLAWQAERIEQLEHELRELKRRPKGMPPLANFTPSESAMLRLLILRPAVSHYALMDSFPHRADINDDIRQAAVMVCKMRKKLAPLGIKIENVYGYGYKIPREEASLALQKLAA